MKDALKIEKHEWAEDERTEAGRHHLVMAGEALRPHGAELIGYATVFIYKAPLINGIEIVPVTALGDIPERVAARAHNALADKMLSRYGKRAPKKRGE